MDFDSSSKFINSLAKFLQSLCNGYVEFDSGVEVVGHIYLNVDTGKTIDYILNEKVCKSNGNSVQFISKSFHAAPAEKPKPPEKKKPTPPPSPDPPSKDYDADESEIILMDEPEDDDSQQYNNQSPAPFNNMQSRNPRQFSASKRPHSQAFSSSHHPSFHGKVPKHTPPPPSNSNIPPSSRNTNFAASDNSRSFHLSNTNSTVKVDTDHSHLPQTANSSFSNSQHPQEQVDIKPVLDLESNVKQEFDPSIPQAQDAHESSTYDDQQLDGSYYSQDQSYNESNEYYDEGGYGQSDEMSKMYGADPGSSGAGGGEDTKDFDVNYFSWQPGKGCPVPACRSSSYKSKFARLSNFRQHWNYLHAPFSVLYVCVLCGKSSKRRDHIVTHCQHIHHVAEGSDECKPRAERRPNTNFIDPYPLTLDDVVLSSASNLNRPQIMEFKKMYSSSSSTSTAKP